MRERGGVRERETETERQRETETETETERFGERQEERGVGKDMRKKERMREGLGKLGPVN